MQTQALATEAMPAVDARSLRAKKRCPAGPAVAVDELAGLAIMGDRNRVQQPRSNPQLRVVGAVDPVSAKTAVGSPCSETRSLAASESSFTEVQALPPLTRLRKASPLRPLDWRWQRASYLRLNGTRPSRFGDDQHVVMAWRFQRVVAKCQNESDWKQLREAEPAVFDAWQFWNQAKGVAKSELEARILAREPFETIGGKMNLAADAVRWFERLFFHVLDRLDSPSYIIHRAVGKIHGRLTIDDIGTLWRFYGYVGGPIVLDDLVHQLPRSKRPGDAEGVQRFFAADFNASLQRKVAIALRCMPVDDPQAALQLMRLSLRLKEIDAKHQVREREHSDITQNIEVFVDQLRTSLDDKVFGRLEGHPLPTVGAGTRR